MIKNFKHKGLKKLFEEGSKKGIIVEHANKLNLILTVLNAANRVEDINSPAFGLHPLKGSLKGYYSVKVNGNWRVIFRFDGKEFTDLDYKDYH